MPLRRAVCGVSGRGLVLSRAGVNRRWLAEGIDRGGRAALDGTRDSLRTRGGKRGHGSGIPHLRSASSFFRDTRPLVKGLVRDERMGDGVRRFDPPIRVPAQTPRDEIHESLVLRLERLLQRLGARPPPPALAADRHPRLAHRVEEEFLARTPLHQMPVRRAENLHDTRQLLLLVFAREDGVACKSSARMQPRLHMSIPKP